MPIVSHQSARFRLPTAALIVAVLAPTFALPSAQDPFDYDKSKPLNYREGSAQTVAGSKVVEISYDSPKIGRVPGYLVRPALPRAQKLAGIVFMHWGQGNKSEFLSEALEMSRRGAVSIMIDAPFLRPDVPAVQPLVEAVKERDLYVQLVVDLRRAVDVLEARNDVDSKHIGYVGHSLGATWGGALVACEKRLKVLVLMGGLPRLTDYDDDSPWSQIQRSGTSREQFMRWAKDIEPINPEHFVGAPGPGKIYFQWARKDMYISEKSAGDYFAAAREPKEQHWYFTSHEFNDDQSRHDRRAWLTKELGLLLVGD
jgi:dienelactone hydrolase